MVCTNPKQLWIKKSWEISVKEEYLYYKKINKNRKEKLTTSNLRNLRNTFIEPKGLAREKYEPITIPCGICKGCRLDHANMWATRIWMETKCWKENVFVTLTYNENTIPKDRQLVKEDIKKFFKRLLKHENREEGNTIRRFYCGEYGDKNKRPHYHAAIFNYKPKDMKIYKQNKQGDNLYTSKELQKIWGKGFVIIGELTYKSACYIARYVQKKAGISGRRVPKDLRGKKIDEFIEASRKPGIGRIYWEENKEEIKRNKGILIKIGGKVKLKKIPRYFKKIWEEENPDEYYKSIAEERATIRKEIEETLEKTSLTKEEYLKVQERNLEERTRILKRNNFI